MTSATPALAAQLVRCLERYRKTAVELGQLPALAAAIDDALVWRYPDRVVVAP